MAYTLKYAQIPNFMTEPETPAEPPKRIIRTSAEILAMQVYTGPIELDDCDREVFYRAVRDASCSHHDEGRACEHYYPHSIRLCRVLSSDGPKLSQADIHKSADGLRCWASRIHDRDAFCLTLAGLWIGSVVHSFDAAYGLSYGFCPSDKWTKGWLKSLTKMGMALEVVSRPGHFVLNYAFDGSLVRGQPSRSRSLGGYRKHKQSFCAICLETEDSVPLQVHHVIERAKGGDDEPSNLMTVCPNCHKRIHDIRRKRGV